MGIGRNIAAKMLQFKLDHELTTVELATELHLAVSTTQEYLNGNGNPRTDTLEMIAGRMGISVIQLISPPPEGRPQLQATIQTQSQPAFPRQARSVLHAAKELAQLPPAKREKGIQLFLELVELWS